jgi:membrane protease YdiL (CAAX protease family)
MSGSVAFGLVVGVLVVVNVVNNRLAPRAYVFTSVLAAALLLAVFRVAGLGWPDAGLAADRVLPGVVVGLAGVAVVAAACLLTALLPATRGVFADRRVEHAGPGAAAYQVLVRIPLGTVLLEEVAFRGVLFGMVSVAHGPLWATGVSAVLFGLWHVLPSGPLTELNPAAGRAFGGRRAITIAAAVVATTLAGVVLCELRRRTGSLIAPMAVHWATNGLGYLTAYLFSAAGRTRGR